MAVRVGMVSLGCTKNLVDAERMMYKIQKAGYQLVDDAALADITIINTCGFIESAKQEAIDTILEFATLKKEGRIKKIIITGCLAERYKDEVAKEIPEADAVIGIGCDGDIVKVIEQIMADEKVVDFKPNTDLELTGGRVQSTLSFTSYIKIAEGCNNRCSYCAIPAIRGPLRSVPMENIIDEAKKLVDIGVREIILIAQDTTVYGQDIYGKGCLPELLKELCKIEKLKWLRFLYSYPERVTDELLDVVANEDKVVKYMDIPIQHCDDDIMRKMRRPGNEKTLKETIKKIRDKVPGIILRTTLITGFPTETEEQFNRLAEFVNEMRFDRLGCFAYSAEDGTVAAEMDGQLSDEVKQHRADIIMEQQMVIAGEKCQQFVGKTIEVVTEGFDRYGECYFGRSSMDAPDIDGKIFFTSPDKKLFSGDFVNVKINDTMDYDLIGEYENESSK